jgi:hypothetical protein
MTQRTRILVAVVIMVVLVGTVLGVEALQQTSDDRTQGGEGEPTLSPGSIPIILDGRRVGGFGPDDLSQLEKVSFVEPEENKEQQGWMLRDVILLYVDGKHLKAGTLVAVSSSSRERLAQLTWAEVDDPANMVMFDLSSRGTLKLVSVMEKLDTRDEWVQDTDKIEITNP